jgi:hypothetical protein
VGARKNEPSRRRSMLYEEEFRTLLVKTAET